MGNSAPPAPKPLAQGEGWFATLGIGVLRAQNVKLPVGLIPGAGALPHVGVVDEGAVLLAIPAWVPFARSQKYVAAGRHKLAIGEGVGAACGKLGIDGGIGENDMASKIKADSALVLKQDEFLFGAGCALYADDADHVEFSLKLDL